MNNLEGIMISDTTILKICEIHFLEIPQIIEKQKIGISNEVYRIVFSNNEYFIRLNKKNDNLIGTRKFLQIFNDLKINVPEIYVEDYTNEKFSCSYQILTKISGDDLEIALEKLNKEEIRFLATEISIIINKFKQLNCDEFFGLISGTWEEKFKSQYEVVMVDIPVKLTPCSGDVDPP